MNNPKSTQLFSLLIFFTATLSFNTLDAQAYVINNYKIEVDISTEGYYDIEEEINVFFNQKRRGIIRNIPIKYKADGETQKVQLSNVHVDAHEFKVLNKGDEKHIRIGNADTYITGPVTYSISYRISNGFIWKENHTEFIYNLITDWDCPITNVEYTITIPDDFDIAFNDYKVITGDTGEDKREASLEKEGRRFVGSSLRPLQPEENITVAIRFPKDYISKPPKPPGIFQKDKFWAIPLVLIGFIFSMFYRSRKEEPVQTRSETYLPPDGLSPAEVGAYHDYKVNTEDIISLLPWWAARGHIKIMGNGMEGKDRDLFFKKIKALPANAPEYQHVIFDEIFKNSDMVVMSELKNKIYSVIFKASTRIRKTLIQKEMYDYEHYQRFHKGWFAFSGLALIITGAIMMIAYQLFITGIITIILGICAAVIHFLRPKRSAKGLRIKAELDALKNFLKNDDGSRTSELIRDRENYLEMIYPFAIALGVDRSWMKTLESSNYEFYAPYWFGYHNTHGITASHVSLENFTRDFSVSDIHSVFTSVPASSSGGGGGGSFSGGSAGGGFGGGGSSW